MSEIDWKTRLFQGSPPPLKNILASVRGAQLEWFRRGFDFDSRVDEALSRERWTVDQWDEFQRLRLQRLLYHARWNVPYYRRFWDSRPTDADPELILDLNSWPVLEKNALRDNPEDFIADNVNKKSLHVWHTSGSTGSPVKILWSRKTMRERWAVFEARSRRWYGVSGGEPYALLGGRMVVPFSNKEPPFWVWNAISRQLYMSSYHLSACNISAYLHEMRRRKIRYIYAYTSSVYELARFMLSVGESLYGINVIVTQAEPLDDYQRKAIEDAFQCPVRSSYGMAEMVTHASECDHGEMHIWPEYGICEIEGADKSIARTGRGELIATGLLNEDMPLIRYRVGDVLTITDLYRRCACGRTLPIVDAVEGRSDDVLVTKDGRRIGRLSTVYKSLPLVEVQTIQTSLNMVILKVVPAPEFNEDSKISLVRALRERMGEITVDVQLVDAIPRSANGKFRSVINQMNI